MPIKLGAGASGAGGGVACAAGTFPPFTTSAGASGSSVSAGFSSTTDLAGAGAELADLVEPALGRELAMFFGDGAWFSEGVADAPRVISGCEAADVEVPVVAGAGGALAGFEGAGAETGADVATGCVDEPFPLKCDHPK